MAESVVIKFVVEGNEQLQASIDQIVKMGKVTEMDVVAFKKLQKAVEDNSKAVGQIAAEAQKTSAAFVKTAEEAKKLGLTSSGFKSLREQIKGAKDEATRLGQEFGFDSTQARAAQQRVAGLTEELDDFNKRVASLNPEAKFNSLNQVLQGTFGGFQALTGALQLFGVENEKVQQIAQQFQGAINVSQGLNSILSLKDAFSNLGTVLGVTKAAKVADAAASNIQAGASGRAAVALTLQAGAANTATVATRGFTAALLANPIIAVAAVLAVIAGAFIAVSAAADEASEATKAVNDALSEGAGNAAKEGTEVAILVHEYKNANIEQARRIEIIDELQKLSPAYFGNLDKENTSIEQLSDAYKKFDEALIEFAKRQSLINKAAEIRAQRAINEAKTVDELVGTYDRIAESFKRNTKQLNDAEIATRKKAQADKELLKQENAILEALTKTKAIEDPFKNAGKDAAENLPKAAQALRDQNDEIERQIKLLQARDATGADKVFTEIKIAELTVEKAVNEERIDSIVRSTLTEKEKTYEVEKKSRDLITERLIAEEKLKQVKEKQISTEFVEDVKRKESTEVKRVEKIDVKIENIEPPKEPVEVPGVIDFEAGNQEIPEQRVVFAAEVDFDKDELEPVKKEIEQLSSDIPPVEVPIEVDIEKLQAYLQEAAGLVIDFNSLLNEMSQDRTDQEIEQATQKSDQEIEQLDRQLKAGTISQETYNKRREQLEDQTAKKTAQLRTQQAVKDKQAAIFEAFINGAVAVTQAYTKDPTGILAAIVAAKVAIEIAAISAKPIPKFQKGTLSVPGVDHGKDTVLAMLQPKEAVTPVRQNKKYARTMKAIHSDEVPPQVLEEAITSHKKRKRTIRHSQLEHDEHISESSITERKNVRELITDESVKRKRKSIISFFSEQPDPIIKYRKRKHETQVGLMDQPMPTIAELERNIRILSTATVNPVRMPSIRSENKINVRAKIDPYQMQYAMEGTSFKIKNADALAKKIANEIADKVQETPERVRRRGSWD